MYLVFTLAEPVTIVFAFSLYQCAGFGITAGVHRLWAHRSYKAKWPLQLMLIIFNTIAFQIGWAYDLKTVPQDMVKKRIEKTGDGSHELWDWGDKDQMQQERDQATIKYNEMKNQ